MAQFYLLSILTLLLGGALAASDFLSERIGALSVLSELAERRTFMMTMGALTAAVGIMKLFLRAPGDGVPVAGDLLPAIAGIAIGGVILMGQMRSRVAPGPDQVEPQARSLVDFRNPIGLAGMIVGLLHFFVPGAVIL